ncbi:MAG: glycosyltransferase [Verrucomicrobiota bacterium]
MHSGRLLFISNVLAMANQHGGCVYPHAILTELHRSGVAIDYAWLGRPLHQGRRLMRDPLTMPYVSRGFVNGTRRIGGFLIPRSLGEFTRQAEADPGEHYATDAEQQFAARLIRRLQPDAVLIDGTVTLTLLDGLSPADRAKIRVGVLTHNLNSRRTDLYRACGQPLDFLPMTAREEAELLARADMIVAIQEREAEAFAQLCPRRTVVTVPMSVRPAPQPQAMATKGRCLFVGGHTGHNIEALRWLFREVWPQVRKTDPDSELVVAGTVGKAFTTAPDGVRIVGPVGDLQPLYAEAAISLVPLPMGTGLKIKLVEAMAWGRAVVTTPAGAEGFADIENGQVAVVSSTAAEFAGAISRLLRDPQWRETVAQRQLAWVERRLNPQAVISPLNGLWSPALN